MLSDRVPGLGVRLPHSAQRDRRAGWRLLCFRLTVIQAGVDDVDSSSRIRLTVMASESEHCAQ
jgi:hypothetical protein